MTQLTTNPEMSEQVRIAQRSDVAPADDGIVLKLASEPWELEAAFRLTYDSYLRAGLTGENPARLRVTAYQLQETSEVFIALKDGIVISTLSLIDDGPLGLPIDKVFGPEVNEFRRSGIHVAEVSCLADRRESVDRSMPMLLKLMRLMCQHSVIRGVDRFLIAVHPRHARYYKRLMGFHQAGEERQYASVLDRPAVALYKDLDYPHAPNTPIYEQFFVDPCPRDQLIREAPRPSDFINRMWPLAMDSQPVLQNVSP